MGTSDKSVKPAVGGGARKILYTLKTVNRIGLNHSAKALTAKNACKACGLGMGGQLGGMTNEQGDFLLSAIKAYRLSQPIFNHPFP